MRLNVGDAAAPLSKVLQRSYSEVQKQPTVASVSRAGALEEPLLKCGGSVVQREFPSSWKVRKEPKM